MHTCATNLVWFNCNFRQIFTLYCSYFAWSCNWLHVGSIDIHNTFNLLPVQIEVTQIRQIEGIHVLIRWHPRAFDQGNLKNASTLHFSPSSKSSYHIYVTASNGWCNQCIKVGLDALCFVFAHYSIPHHSCLAILRFQSSPIITFVVLSKVAL